MKSNRRAGSRATSPEPFWEAAYADPGASAFGPPSDEILALVDRLPAGARVLDLGCGDGRNALPLARAGFTVEAVDTSPSGIERLRRQAADEHLPIEATVGNLESSVASGAYDLVIAHGVLHLLPAAVCLGVVAAMQEVTRPRGWNVVVVFTDRLPQPPDLAPFIHRPFRDGELAELYRGWEIELLRAYVLEDQHPGGIRHRHAIEKVVARHG